MKRFPINSQGSIIIFELHDDKEKIDINVTLYQGLRVRIISFAPSRFEFKAGAWITYNFLMLHAGVA